ncbi:MULTISPECIES: phosphatidate cytidylyltransferase [unclassified Rhodococcus (in: high G+C Gram-positive bacteria)]|uniref:phosphatidate cytidylyltransferase n=1 Tax=unclassified Rhodococcus (in: high G+C Gram-positive bacteria) TaxID=192944 RepID=UPI000928460B|nr:phosphatidate cytidylyltransferase [Rhodococcus sp. M8]OLL17484.1 phosphatidate cytidylyltransferase [Rhodococcus sp. M8]QPG45753.1 phosphatidate cytidylyltransferase [Rhodococcus sp. M8]
MGTAAGSSDPQLPLGVTDADSAAEAAKADPEVPPVRPDATPTAEPVKKSSRAGRNLPAAVGVGAGLGALVIVVLAFAPKAWLVVVAVAIAIATWEVTKRLREADVLVPRIPLLVGGQAMIWLGWPYGTTGVLGAFAGTTVVSMLWRLFDRGLRGRPRNYLRDTAVTVFTAAWVPFLASFATLMVLDDNGAARVFCLMIVCVASDVGGYAAGVLFGKHPMAPAISPKKSWEGFGGSVLACTVAGILTVTLLLDAAWWIGALLGVVLAATATASDLIESQVKRDLGIKDMGTLLPGHGGIMDRLDSILPSAFVTWLVLGAFV